MTVEAIAARYDVDALHASKSCIVVVGADSRITWANRAWFQFGRDNGALPGSVDVGSNYFAAIPPDLRAHLLDLAAESRQTRKPFQFDYECSSGTKYRAFRLQGLPLESGGILFVHSLRIARPHDRQESEPLLNRYVGTDGLLTMCSHCRRVRRVEPVAWEWVPDWIEHPPCPITHGLCPVCTGFHWGKLSPLRVLVADDDASLRRIIHRILERRSYEVIECASVGEAQELLADGSFDALLADLHLTDGSGLDLVDWARRRLPTLRCAIVSGYAPPDPLAPDIAWITKPFTEEELVRPLPRLD